MSLSGKQLRMPSKSRNGLLRWVERFLLGAGAVLVMYWGGFQAWAEHHRQTQVAAFEVDDSPDQSLWSPGRVEAFEHSLAVASDGPVGLLTIPSGLQVPIYDGASDLNLDRGVARIEGTADLDAMGNLAIAGHRDGFFRTLKDAAVGDRIELRTPSGVRVYEIEDMAVIEPNDVSVLRDTPDRALTLLTCYPFYFVGDAPQRFVVRAIAVNPQTADS